MAATHENPSEPEPQAREPSGALGDKTGDALKQQRFQMLEDIAAEMSDEVVFPSYFDAVLRLRNALRDPEVSVERIVGLVRAEPLICVRLLQQANSAAQGGRGEVRDIRSAVTRLGLNAVRNVALTVAMAQLVRCKELVPFADLSRKLWLHSLFSAAAAEVVAAELSRINPDEALFAGLVHDLGAFYMLYRAAQYEELRMRPDTVRHLIVQWHESIGESLMFALRLPEDFVNAVSHHDQPRAPLIERPRNLGEIVYAANLLALADFEWIDGRNPEGLLGELYTSLAERIRVRFEELRAEFSGA
ncbi:HDOD domain-containing protein [Pseudothauera nasutitermitis]|uniref:HDOD domain-containing protein n=1 Tax=Pseudothauera nasutitermitis TaxID=2565930 RepID=A0A4S4AQ72_9RHOO|nr:HDOD domain-containing protein [Pseudothauera nasutitermitis]THF61886.1 HDOD domain-containing protein [Pseudothauera nasutitermitis]